MFDTNLTLKKLPILGEGSSSSEKPWKPKEQPKPEVIDEFETEWDDVLRQATEEELVDLAGNLKSHATPKRGFTLYYTIPTFNDPRK